MCPVARTLKVLAYLLRTHTRRQNLSLPQHFELHCLAPRRGFRTHYARLCYARISAHNEKEVPVMP